MRPSARASVAAAAAMSAHCTVNLCPGYSGASIGSCSARADRVEPARAIEAHRVAHAPVGAGAEAQQRVVEIGELRRQPLRRRRRRRAVGARAARRMRSSTPPRPSHALRHCGTRSSSRSAVGGPTVHRVAAHDGALEGLERGDLAHADVAIAVARRAGSAGSSGRITPTSEQHEEQHRHDGDARRDRELEQRGRAPLSHARRATAR